MLFGHAGCAHELSVIVVGCATTLVVSSAWSSMKPQELHIKHKMTLSNEMPRFNWCTKSSTKHGLHSASLLVGSLVLVDIIIATAGILEIPMNP